MRVILCTGKGGVGKTSVAAATALRSAELGHRTIVLSTDAAHSLSDSFEVALGNELKPIAPNLWGQETDLPQALEDNWRDIHNYLSALLAWRGMDDVVADEVAISPGMEELANLLYILRYRDAGDYDVAVVDCAPTGETLRLLSFPEMLNWWMTKIFPLGRRLIRGVRPLAKTITKIPLPDTEVFRSVEELFTRLQKIHALLTDAEKTSVRLVVNPEKMVVKEAQRSFTYFNLYGYFTDLIICNRLLPDKIEDHYFQLWKDSQRKYRELIDEGFAPIPILDVPLFEREVVGLPMLRTMAEVLYGDKDPVAFFAQEQVQHIHKEDGYYVLTLALPFSKQEKISLLQTGNELAIQVAGFRRNVILPRALTGLAVTEAAMEAGRLRVKFGTKQTGKTKRGEV